MKGTRNLNPNHFPRNTFKRTVKEIMRRVLQFSMIVHLIKVKILREEINRDKGNQEEMKQQEYKRIKRTQLRDKIIGEDKIKRGGRKRMSPKKTYMKMTKTLKVKGKER